MRIHLNRFAYTPMGAFGVLIVGDHRWYTVEPPWRDNRPSVSCIPEGIYPMSRHSGLTKPGARWRIDQVPDRFFILVHVGNTKDDTEGCICPGLGLGFVSGKWAVTSSRDATTQFNREMSAYTSAEIVVGFDRDAWR